MATPAAPTPASFTPIPSLTPLAYEGGASSGGAGVPAAGGFMASLLGASPGGAAGAAADGLTAPEGTPLAHAGAGAGASAEVLAFLSTPASVQPPAAAAGGTPMFGVVTDPRVQQQLAGAAFKAPTPGAAELSPASAQMMQMQAELMAGLATADDIEDLEDDEVRGEARQGHPPPARLCCPALSPPAATTARISPPVPPPPPPDTLHPLLTPAPGDGRHGCHRAAGGRGAADRHARAGQGRGAAG